MSATTERQPTQSITITLWVLRILLAAIFLASAVLKLIGYPMMVAEFARVDFGQWFRYFTALLELSGGILILMPRYSPFGALILLVVDVGAFFAQVTTLHMGWIHPIVIGLMLGAVIYLQRGKLTGSTI